MRTCGAPEFLRKDIEQAQHDGLMWQRAPPEGYVYGDEEARAATLRTCQNAIAHARAQGRPRACGFSGNTPACALTGAANAASAAREAT